MRAKLDCRADATGKTTQVSRRLALAVDGATLWLSPRSRPSSRPFGRAGGTSRRRDRERTGCPLCSTPTGKKRWTNGRLRRILTNPVYTGVVYAGRGRVQPAKKRRSALTPVGQRTMTSILTSKDQWIVVGHIPALVTAEHFEQVLLLTQNQPAIRSPQQPSP